MISGILRKVFKPSCLVSPSPAVQRDNNVTDTVPHKASQGSPPTSPSGGQVLDDLMAHLQYELAYRPSFSSWDPVANSYVFDFM